MCKRSEHEYKMQAFSFFKLFLGLSPLHLAVLQGRKDLARMLLDAGADINAMVSPCCTDSALWVSQHHGFFTFPLCIL